MTTTLITGANKSLGYETARQLVALGHTVYVGARDPERGRKAADELGARFVQLEVTDDESVQNAVKQIQEEVGQLDVLVNNAGVPGPFKPADELTADDFQAVYNVNVFGAFRVLNAFLPLLKASENPVVVNVSSGLGSITMAADPTAREAAWIPAPIYSSSKAALNMLTAQYAHLHPEMRINAVDPGYTATDFNAHRGHQSIPEGAASIIRLATIDKTGPTATYQRNAGLVPW
ncbi:SDR family NAD(P)-dependent oxidoreductase [Kribbella sp. NPDC051718]|uniref:SDR family NAD(P)-dependent oxidoreductase n=1 Tax=Kribbella sp. NPDC051718 TaxID=3155168 RepID=UPI00341DD097